MTYRTLSLIFVLLFLPFSSSSAGMTEQGTGMLFGVDHAFFITAAKGWVLDNESGVEQGLHMVFYPAGYTWSNSPVIAYGRKVSKTGKIKSVKDQVEATVNQFHENGSPNYSVTKESSITLPNGGKAPVYHYAGDKWGNFEAVAYFEEKNTINFLVFNARGKTDFDSYLPAFEQMAATYWSTGSSEPVDDKTFKRLAQEAKQMLKTPSGKEYEEKVMKGAGDAVATFIRSCSSYVGEGSVKPFEAIFRIRPDGSIYQAFVKPDTALSTCFEGLFLQTKHPPHEFGSFLLHINVKTR